MSIGLPKSRIEERLNAILFEELVHITGIKPYEKITKVVADIITENNALIEREIQEQIRHLKTELRR